MYSLFNSLHKVLIKALLYFGSKYLSFFGLMLCLFLSSNLYGQARQNNTQKVYSPSFEIKKLRSYITSPRFILKYAYEIKLTNVQKDQILEIAKKTRDPVGR